jgi:site-specific DNA-methyltransferase (adenine-specific)
MQFDVIIGNPPYQLSTGGGTATQQASPIYQEFVKKAKALEPRYIIMVIPSRWFAGGMPVLDAFRKDMLGDHRIRQLVDFPDSREAFTGVDIAGGVNYFLWDSTYDGSCKITTVSGGQPETAIRELDVYPVFVRSNGAIAIVERVIRAEGFKPLARLVSAVSPFGLPTSFRGSESSHQLKSPIVVRSTAGRQFTERDVITRNTDWIDHWKVLLSATSSEHAGQADRNGMRRIFSRIEILEPGTAATHSYLIVGPAASEAEAVNVAHYLRTKFVRFLVSLLLATQHVSKSTFAFVPNQDFSRTWTDDDLYARYHLSPNEIALIESTIRPMVVDDA